MSAFFWPLYAKLIIWSYLSQSMSQYSRIKTDKFRERSYTSYIIKKEKKKNSHNTMF